MTTAYRVNILPVTFAESTKVEILKKQLKECLNAQFIRDFDAE